MKRTFAGTIVTTLLTLSTFAAADKSKVLVLHSEGQADAKTRARIDAAIVKLAKTGPDTVTPGEITYSEAAAMVGCKPDEATCRDEVITTLAVDELVIVTVNPKPPGFEISVRRAGRAGAIHDATTSVTADKLDKVDALAPLFGGKAPPVTEPPPVGPIGPVGPVGPKPPVTEPPVSGIGPKPPVTEPPLIKPDEPNKVGDVIAPPKTDPTSKPEPLQSDKQPRDRKRLYIAGMASGGGMVFVGILLYASASSTQGQIDSAPTKTKADILALKDLESRGSSLAGWGNAFTIGGIVLGGVSTYFYLRHRHDKKSSTAMLVPTMFDHGGGLTLSFGGSR